MSNENSITITPETPAATIAKYLAENLEREKIREIYEHLPNYLPPPERNLEKEKKETEYSNKVIDDLNLNDKESIVTLLHLVQTGHISCRRTATEIQKRLKPKK